jgi:hypothetical protein
MNMNLRPAFLLSFAILAGCATSQGPAPPKGTAPPPSSAPPPAAANAAFRASDFAWSTAPGRGSIDGQITYKAAGTAYGCTASGVILTPETPWVRERMRVLYSSTDHTALPADDVRRRTPPERSQDYSAFIRRVKCGAAGEFTFADLPDGAWYVITIARPANGGAGQEMALMHRVVIRDGKPAKVRL